MQKSNQKIVIVGGGNAGLSVASQLLQKNSNLKITIIDPATKHYYQPAWTLVGAGIFDIAKTERNQADYIPPNTEWVKDAVDYTNTPTMTFPFNQAKPNWLMWILKTKILPWLYWNKILTGKA